MNVTKIREIPISEIDDFPDHPYRVVDDEDMDQLGESILLNGVITPSLVRRKENGQYELISGHRRKRAVCKAGLTTLRCEVINVTREEAVVMMADANVQRPNLLPSEKAFAYKMRIGMRPAVEVSFLPESMQKYLWEAIQLYQCTLSHAQTIEMRKYMEEGILDREGIEIIMHEDKPNQKERFILHSERVNI